MGNFVTHEGEPMQVNYKTFELIEAFDYFCLEPIPLTEEILLKCGFVEIKVLGGESHFSIELGQNVMLVVSNVGSVTCCACMCKVSQHENSLYCVSNSVFDFPHVGERLSLHQLQNLYFALTGKELEIKWQ